MKKYQWIKLLVVLLITAGLWSCSHKNGSKEIKPNVVIILTDDMGYGDISCYNQEQVQTPNIDQVAKEGVLFTDFYVPTPYCAPSRATLLTGRFPLRHGLVQNPAPDAGKNDIGINANEITLGNIYQDAGYHTKCIGKWHLGHIPEYFPVKHGFDEYYGILYSNDMRPVQIIENMDTVEYPVDQTRLTKKYTEKAIEFIERNQNHPFFLHLCNAMPHKPLAASGDFFDSDSGTSKDLYKSVLRELDWSVGEIMNTLKKLNILDNTVVIFMSDNGPWYGGSTGGLKGMKATNWEGGTRVPFIIRYPQRFPQNKTVSVPCWSPDVLPTLVNLSGLSLNPKIKIDGQDISDIINGKSKVHSPIFTMSQNQIHTIRDGNWKLFLIEPKYYKEIDPKKWKGKRAPDGTTIIAPYQQPTPTDYPGVKPMKTDGKVLLFDLENDPVESHNLSNDHPEVVKRLREEFDKFMSTISK